MNIIFVISTLRPRGPVFVLRHLVEGMQAAGHQCAVWYFDEGGEIAFPCPVRRISFWASMPMQHADIVHAHGLRANLYVRLHAQRGRTYIQLSTVHAYPLEEFKRGLGNIRGHVFNELFIFSLRKMDAVVALSKDMRRYLFRWLPESKVYWAYNGIPPIQTASVVEQTIGSFFAKNDVRLICHAALVEIKGIEYAIRALEYLPEHYKLWINGEGECRPHLERLAVQMQLSDRVHFQGDVPHECVYFPSMHLFLQCAFTEGFCLSMAEAAACGINVVCSDIPGMRERYDEEMVTYFRLYPSVRRTAYALAQAIQHAVQHPEKSIKLQTHALRTFSIENMTAQYLNIYHSVAENKDRDRQ